MEVPEVMSELDRPEEPLLRPVLIRFILRSSLDPLELPCFILFLRILWSLEASWTVWRVSE